MVSEIWLHRDGDEVEIVYMNQFFVRRPVLTQRKLKKESVSRTFLTPSFQATDDVNSLEYRVLAGEHFPRSNPVRSKTKSWAWTRYFHNNNEFFLIPKRYTYMDKDTLVAVLNGKMINTGPQHVFERQTPKIEELKKTGK